MADNVFEPLMAANTAVKWLIGSGKGAGMALMFLGTGILGAITCLSGYLIKDVRNLEAIMPDYDQGKTHN